MTPSIDTPLRVYVNIQNQWNYPLESFSVVVEHLVDFLTEGKMSPDESLTSLGYLVDYQIECTYHPGINTELSDYYIMTQIENRYFELYDSAKELLNIILSEYPELRTMYTFNIEDVSIIRNDEQWALLEITGKPFVGRLLCQPLIPTPCT